MVDSDSLHSLESVKNIWTFLLEFSLQNKKDIMFYCSVNWLVQKLEFGSYMGQTPAEYLG